MGELTIGVIYGVGAVMCVEVVVGVGFSVVKNWMALCRVSLLLLIDCGVVVIVVGGPGPVGGDDSISGTSPPPHHSFFTAHRDPSDFRLGCAAEHVSHTCIHLQLL